MYYVDDCAISLHATEISQQKHFFQIKCLL